MSEKKQTTERTKYDPTELSNIFNLPMAALNMILDELPPEHALEVSAHIPIPEVPEENKWSVEAKGIAQRINQNISIVYSHVHNAPADGAAALPQQPTPPQALNQLHQIRSIDNEIQSLDRPLLDRIQFWCSFLIHFGEERDDYPTMQRNTVKFAVFCAVVSALGFGGGFKKGDDIAIGIGGVFGAICFAVVVLMAYRKYRHDRAQRLTASIDNVINAPQVVVVTENTSMQVAPGYGSTFHQPNTDGIELATHTTTTDATLTTPLLPAQEEDSEEQANDSRMSFQQND